MHMSGLSHRYSAAQLHFHWGFYSLLPTGSEHTVNGRQFAAEMHVVHFNSEKYPNVSMAVDKSDGLAVLGVLVEVGEFNPSFDQFLKYINGIKYRDQRVQVPGFDIRALLPARLDEYYRYDGSLTTPPCYPSVLWTVFRSPVAISPKQFRVLATALYASNIQESAPVHLNGNYRKPQLTDNRVVLVSFQEGHGLHGALTVSSPALRRRVIQQLLVGDLGDLADLADEGLYQLLPELWTKPWAARKWKNTKSAQRNWSHVTQKQQWLKKNQIPGGGGSAFNPSIWKGAQAGYALLHAGALNLDAGRLCFVALEEDVACQLRRLHAEGELVQSLRRVVFPELNLRSYLDCKSDLDLQTNRALLRCRPTDEANELDRSLIKALGPQKRPALTQQRGVALTKQTGTSQAAVLKSGVVHTRHRFPQQVEWED